MKKSRMTKAEKAFYRVTLSQILSGNKPEQGILKLWGFLQANKTY
jgi:hypothetical protein